MYITSVQTGSPLFSRSPNDEERRRLRMSRKKADPKHGGDVVVISESARQLAEHDGSGGAEAA